MDNTPLSPRIQILKNIITAIKSGKFDSLRFNGVISELKRDIVALQGIKNEMSSVKPYEIGVDIKLIEGAIENYNNGINHLIAGSSFVNNMQLDDGLISITKAEDILFEIFQSMCSSYKNIKTEITEDKIIICVFCGENNNKENKFCIQCNKGLPKPLTEITEYQDILDKNLEGTIEVIEESKHLIKFKELISDLSSGVITLIEFNKFINSWNQRFENLIQRLLNLRQLGNKLYGEVQENLNYTIDLSLEFSANLKEISITANNGNYLKLKEFVPILEELAQGLNGCRLNFKTIKESIS